MHDLYTPAGEKELQTPSTLKSTSKSWLLDAFWAVEKYIPSQ
jgi:hypothetical protein